MSGPHDNLERIQMYHYVTCPGFTSDYLHVSSKIIKACLYASLRTQHNMTSLQVVHRHTNKTWSTNLGLGEGRFTF